MTEWEEELAEYSREHPHMRIVDSFDKIRPIMSRFSMLAPFDTNGISLVVSPIRNVQQLVLGNVANGGIAEVPCMSPRTLRTTTEYPSVHPNRSPFQRVGLPSTIPPANPPRLLVTLHLLVLRPLV